MNLEQAYRVIFNFLLNYYSETYDEGLGDLLSSMHLDTFINNSPEPMSADPIVWEDWEDTASKITDKNYLSSEEAYRAMIKFLQPYNDKWGFEIQWIIDILSRESHNSEKWVKLINKVDKVNDTNTEKSLN